MTTVALRETTRKQGQKKGFLLSFLLGAMGAFFIFLPFLIVDKGLFQYCGDYNSQQIPFYLYVQQFVKNGGGTWSWATDIGSSAVNSYSFYNLGSPFLWITMIFPSRWLPFMMVPLFMAKFGAIAASAYLYISRYAKNKNAAVVCSVLYAFCGFNVYNTFFNHMLDPVAIFPLMLWALDGFILDKKRGWFAISVGLALLNSYFFFIGNVVFLFIYFFVKLVKEEYTLDVKDFGILSLEVVMGVGLGMVLALPAYFNLVANPRTGNFANGFNMIMYWHVQQYFEIFTSMILPPDPPYLPNLFTEGAIRWTSMSAFLPIVGIGGVAAYLKGCKKSGLKTILLFCAVCAFIPFLNSGFYAFNASYYARWYYMPILMMCLATMYSLEDEGKNLVFGAKVSLFVTAGYALFGLIPTQKDGKWKLGVAQYASKFWLTILTAIIGAGIFYIVVTAHRKKVKFMPLLLSAIMGFSVFYSVIHISLGKFPQWERDANYRAQMYDAGPNIQLPEDQFYRIDTFGSYDNLGLWLDKSCLQTFNSVVTPSIMEFYPMVGVKRDVSSKPSANNYALRGLLSVRYTFVPLNKLDVPIDFIPATRQQLGVSAEQYSMPYDTIPVPFEASSLQLGWAPDAGGNSYIGVGGSGAMGWRYYDTQGGYAIFENENFVPLGFTYDQYVSMDNLLLANESDRAGLLMQGIGLNAEQITRYGDLFGGNEIGMRLDAPEGYPPNSQFTYQPSDYFTYTQDCSARRSTSSYEVQADSSGFTSKIKLDKENLVFFGVPYDPGFTAMVNGTPAEVLQVSGGMMAVRAPAGDNTIVFTYKTPGMQVGAIISVVSLLALCLYMAISIYLFTKKKRLKAADTTEAAQAKAILRTENHPPPGREIPHDAKTVVLYTEQNETEVALSESKHL